MHRTGQRSTQWPWGSGRYVAVDVYTCMLPWSNATYKRTRAENEHSSVTDRRTFGTQPARRASSNSTVPLPAASKAHTAHIPEARRHVLVGSRIPLNVQTGATEYAMQVYVYPILSMAPQTVTQLNHTGRFLLNRTRQPAHPPKPASPCNAYDAYCSTRQTRSNLQVHAPVSTGMVQQHEQGRTGTTGHDCAFDSVNA